jgi:hypothetical protein
MPDLSTHSTDLRAIADTYRDRREAGAVDHTAFVAAIISYRLRHPDVGVCEAALIIDQLVSDYPQEWETCH